MKTIALDIYETPSGWTLRGKRYSTAMRAFNTAKRIGKENAPSIVVLNWNTVTPIGKVIARSFGGEE